MSKRAPTICRLGTCILLSMVGCDASVEGTTPSSELEGDAAVARVDQEFRTGWWGDGHGEITEKGLTFLNTSVVDELVAQNLGVDGPPKCDDNSRLDWVATDCPFTKLRSEYHFDNCRIEETFASLRFRYAALLSALAPDAPDLPEARRRFGQILHTMQDFYAHSNWVDAHETGLIAERGFSLPAGRPGDPLGERMMVVAAPMFVSRTDRSRLPLLSDASGALKVGLITGTYTGTHGNIDAPICPTNASIEHGDPFYQGDPFWDPPDPGTYLSKDDPDSLNHDDAVKMAKRQTTEEFCRLVRLVLLRYGAPGRALLLDGWVSDRGAYEAACPGDRSIVAAVIIAAL